LGKDDSILFVAPIKDKKTVALVSEQNFCVAFDLSSISLLKKATAGIIGMKVTDEDNLSYATVLGEEDAFVVNEKRYALSKLDTGKRGTKGKKM